MPQALPVVFAAGKAIFATVAGSAFLKTVAVNLIIGAISNALAPKPRRPEPTAIKGNYTGSVNFQQIVFGEVRTGGQVLTLGTSGGRNEFFHLATLHSLSHAGGTGGIQGVWVDDKFIPWTNIDGSGDVTSGDFVGIANFRRYDGSQTTADSTLVSALSAQGLWDSSAAMRGGQYLAGRYERIQDDEKFQKALNGFPVQEVLSRGVKCYDPRQDSTKGGSGALRADDSSTWTYGDHARNPACILATYMLMRRVDGGAEIAPGDIVWPTVAAAANRCDETISTPAGSIPVYRCDIALNTGNAVEDNIRNILTTMQGALVPTWEGFKVYAGQYDAPVDTVNGDWILAYEYRDRTPNDQRYNIVKATFTDADSEYRVRDAVPFSDAAYIAEDGGQRLSLDIQLAGVNNQYRAQYISQLLGRRSRLQKQLTLTLNARGRILEAWDTITVQIPEIGLNSVFRIVNWEPTRDGAVVECIEEAASVYTLTTLTTDAGFSNPTPTEEAPPQVTGAVATGVADGIALTWSALEPTSFSVYDVERSNDGSTGWAVIWQGKATELTDPLTGGQTRYYRIRARSPRGTIFGAYSSVVNATAKTVESGATAGADWSTNLINRPTWTTDGTGQSASSVVADLRTTGYIQVNGTTYIGYSDGTDIDTLKPAQSGATAGADWSTNLANRPTWTTDGSGQQASEVIASLISKGEIVSDGSGGWEIVP